MLREATVTRPHAAAEDGPRRDAAGFFPARAGTPPRTLLLVRRDQRDVYEHLARCFARVRGVEVRLDQRVDAGVAPEGAERRRARPVFDAFGVSVIQRAE